MMRAFFPPKGMHAVNIEKRAATLAVVEEAVECAV
jgi:hypothetical protein